MNADISQKENLLYRLLLALSIIVIAAALRISPHPWNFTPIGAMALFSGAVIKDRRIAFAFPLLALFAGDLFVGLYKPGLMLLVYTSFLLSVLIGRFLQGHRTVLRISAGTLLGSVQFFLVTNFAAWWLLNSYPKTPAGLAACYLAGLPLFWNTLAGDAFYCAVFFGAFALAERFVPILREPARAAIR
ncbi:MAG TPA: DUF6580 family putative transport protein [Candidatus Acidoferrum sp.]|nr:DUF6580 family putative transport protein [Candidatus Acidoferrum sp.]